MKVKIFQIFRHDEVQNLEKEINVWLDSNPKITVVRSDASMAVGVFREERY